MTIVAAISDGKKVYVGADVLSAAMESGECNPSSQPKIFEKDGLIIGGCGSWRQIQILQYQWTVPGLKNTKASNEDLDKYIISTVGESIRDCLDQYDFLKDGNWADNKPGCLILIAFKHLIYIMQEDCAVLRSNNEYDAIGPSELAFGSFASTNGLKPKERLQLALMASEKHSIGVQGPFLYLET